MKTETPSARSARRSASLQSVLNVVLVFGILLMVNYLGFKYYKHQDLSASQFYTLSPKTIGILKNLDSTLTIYTFLDEKNPPAAEQIATLLKEYQRIGGKNVIVEKIDPAFDITRAADLQKKLHFDGNDHLIILDYKDRTPRFVKEEDLYDINPATGQMGGFKGEQQITAAITNMVEGKVSRVYFTEGHGEHSVQDATAPTGYGIVGQSLKNENIQVDNLNLAQKGDVPADADAVVIAGPVISFSPIEVEALDKYLAANGKLLVLQDPYTISGLDDLLEKYGLKYEDDLILYRGLTTTGTQMTVPLAMVYQGGFSMHPITAKFAAANLQLLIYDARSITLPADAKGQPNPKVQFLLQTTPDSWGWINKDAKSPGDPKQLTYNKTTDIAGPLNVAAEYDGGDITDPKTSATVASTRIVAVGCSKFLQNDTAETVGANFFANSVDWLVKKNAVLDISPKKPQEYGVSLSPMQFRTVLWCALIFVPGAALLAGAFTWFSRRK
jgi:ABC-type uncharacterized transport system involved in gliding motility auxiliary subunit